MKIIEIGTGYTPIPAQLGAATEIVIENLITEFSQSDIDCELVDINFSKIKNTTNSLFTTHYINLPKWLSIVNDNGFVHILRRIVYSIKLSWFLKKYLKQNKEEIFLHFHNQFNFFFVYIVNNSLLRKYKIQTIYTIHSPLWLIIKKIKFKLILEKFAIEKSDHVIALTELIKNKLLSIAKIQSESQIYVISNGVSTKTYCSLHETEKRNIILNIGSICPRKNQLASIMAIKEILEKYNFEFHFAGKIIVREYYAEIQKYIKENNLESKVKYIGEIKPGEDLNKIYNSAKFYVSHSLQEAFSLVLLESMSSGLPVVLFESFNTFLDPNSDLKSIISISNNIELKKTIESLIQSEEQYANYRTKQMNYIRNHYSWENIANETLKLINQ